MTKQVRLYGCGGAGVNLTSHYLSKKTGQNCAELLPALIDTSRSNLHGRDVDNVETFLVDGLDGSGKIRSENHKEIASRIKQILVDVKPTDVNIVLFSGAGGSGSVLAPLLIRELLHRELSAIAVVIGDDTSTISAENTLKTLQSLEKIASSSKAPVVMFYEQNSKDVKRSEVDAEVFNAISCLSILLSGENLELDGKDIEHWLRYNKVYGGPGQLSLLQIAANAHQLDDVRGVLSLASLYSNPDVPHVQTDADYHTDGYVDLSHADLDQLHFIIGINGVAEIGTSIRSRVNEMLEARAARVNSSKLLDGTASTDDDLIL